MARISILTLALLSLSIATHTAPALLAQGGADVELPETYFPELGGILQQAVNQSPQLLSSEWRLKEAEGQLQTAYSVNKPRVNLTSQLLYRWEDREDLDGIEGDPLVHARLQMTQPLYHWGAVDARRRAGELHFENAETRVGTTVRDVFIDTRVRYLSLVQTRLSRQAHQTNVELAERLLERQEKLLEMGKASPQQVLETRILLQEAEENVFAAERYILDLEEALQQTTGIAVAPQPVTLEDFPAFEPASDDALDSLANRLPQAADAAPELEMARRSLKLEEHNYTQINSRTKPHFDLVAGAYQDHIDTIGETDTEIRYNYFVGVQVNWNLFDGSETRGQKISSLARQRMYEAEIDRTRDAILNNNRKLLRAIRYHKQQIQARDRRVALLENSYALKERQSEQGIIAPNELLREKIGLDFARNSAREARVQYLINASQLLANLGEDPYLQAYELKNKPELEQ